MWHRRHRQAGPDGGRGGVAPQADARRDPPPRSGRRGPLDRGSGRARTPAARHRRRGGRAPADVDRRRRGMARLQRRDLQSRPGESRARAPRASLPHALGHRDDPASLAGRRRALRRPPLGHVRLRALGSPAAAALAGPRPARDQAALLCADGARAPLRLGDQGHPGGEPRPAALQRGDPARVPRDALRRRRGDVLPGDQEAPARPHAHLVAGWRGPDAALLAPPGENPSGRAADGGRRARRADAASGGRLEPSDERRAARRVPVRRHRLDRDRGADGAHGDGADSHVLGGLRGGGGRRAAVRAPRRASGRRRAPGGRRLAGGVLPGAAAAGLARGRADRVHLERPALLRLAARCRGRQGGADRRRRRRALPRVQPLPGDGVERAGRPRL